MRQVCREPLDVFFGGFGISSTGGVLRGVMATAKRWFFNRTKGVETPLCFPSFPCCFSMFFQVERRMKAENEEHVHFKPLGVSPWKAKRFCDKKIQVKSRQDSLVWFFVEAYLQSRITNKRILQVTNESQAFQKMFHTYTTMYRCALRRIQSSWYLIWQYISYDAYYRIFQFHKTDNTS